MNVEAQNKQKKEEKKNCMRKFIVCYFKNDVGRKV